ncbi:unnamed protein product [Brachionus calyciflorus]|uniref:Uncharacterized protein n=1 Tax=Brachionus calyciflorus TaxID=104777 RepID=A0A814DW21_9BILA|nr:unnamed protein product [Brachionus calyciflorus]
MKIIQLLDLVETKPFSSMNTKNNTSLDLERPKLLINRFVSSAQEGNLRPKTNLNIVKQAEAKNKKENSFVRTPVKDSLRERHIKEWAFKKIDLKDLLKSKEFEPKHDFEKHKKNFVVIEDDDVLLDETRQIDLSELVDTEADAEFYRQHRNSGMYKNKADAQKNILFKLLDKRLLDISKDRFKFANYVDYQKKIFIKKQILKSKSLPGLNCIALETFNPHQFDQLQDLEATLNNSRKQKKIALTASAIRKKSSIRLLKPNKTKNSNMSDDSDSDYNESFKFEINSVNLINSIKKTAEANENVNTNRSNKPLNSSMLSNQSKLNDSLTTPKKLITNFLDESMQNNFQKNDSDKMIKRESIYRFPPRRDTSRNIYKHNGEVIKSIKTPMIDYRFNNLINFIKPCYLHEDQKDINRIINDNDALKLGNRLNLEKKEKVKKLRENGERIADVARKIIESGEYTF